MAASPVPSPRARRPGHVPHPSDERGIALFDVVVAAAVLIAIAVPAAEIVMTSSGAVSQSKAQAVAQSLASGQIEADRQLFSSSAAPPSAVNSSVASFSSSNSDGCSITSTGYGAGLGVSANALGYYLTGCERVQGGTFFVWQEGGWCVSGNGTLHATGGSDTTPLFVVDVMVSWGPGTPPAPSTYPPATKSILLSSVLKTPSTYSGSTSSSAPWTCPL